MLDVERSHLAVSAEYAQSEARLLLDLIRIYKSLGTDAPTPTHQEVASVAPLAASAVRTQPVLIFSH